MINCVTTEQNKGVKSAGAVEKKLSVAAGGQSSRELTLENIHVSGGVEWRLLSGRGPTLTGQHKNTQ